MNLVHRIGLALLLFIVVLGLVGCPETVQQTGKPMTFRMTPFELALRLDMDVTEQTDRYIEMKNANNRVVIFIHEGGRVFVNQNPIGNTGPVTRLNHSIYLPEILASTIRPHLKSSTWVAPTQQPKPKWTPPTPGKKGGLIVIDPGHGGKDPGTTSYLGHAEKGINLRIANKVAAKLKAKGFDVKMTRSSDTYIDKYDRAELANKIGPDLLVSIHCDSLQTLTMRGYTVYVSRSASQNSRMAAGLVEDALTTTGLASRGVRQGDYVVLVDTKCPAILVECGCLSNPREAALLYDGTFQEKIATSLANGIAQAMSRL